MERAEKKKRRGNINKMDKPIDMGSVHNIIWDTNVRFVLLIGLLHRLLLMILLLKLEKEKKNMSDLS